jgi:hypothetical protein
VNAPIWLDVNVTLATPVASVGLDADDSVPPDETQNTVAPATGFPGRSVART